MHVNDFGSGINYFDAGQNRFKFVYNLEQTQTNFFDSFGAEILFRVSVVDFKR